MTQRPFLLWTGGVSGGTALGVQVPYGGLELSDARSKLGVLGPRAFSFYVNS